MRIMTCNVRYSAAQDGPNNWVNRRDLCLRVVRQQSADVICCQEMSAKQCAAFKAGLPDYAWFGMIDEPGTNTPVNSIFFRADRYQLVSAGGYWLSQTPHVTGSSSWDSRCVRLCNWVRLVDQHSGKELRIVNTHLDHISQVARENQIRLILEDAAGFDTAFPQVLTGDMNCNAANPAMRSVFQAGWQDTYQQINGADDPGNTFHGFMGAAAQNAWEGKIDFVFSRGGLKATGAKIVTENESGRYPSDHYFVWGDLEFC